uniref:Adenosine kinase n=1 Tax=Dendroctonus ponderosae TaxID=77166 RepID=J3JW96_DENPD|nr:unknown [Dendroctonus ponderosae]
MKSILAFGNPLLDITIYSSCQVARLLDKYNLQIDSQKEITKEEMCMLSKHIEGSDQQVTAGGCCQNSLRVLQWIMHKRCNVAIFGSTGQDQEADILRNILESDAVSTRYITQEGLPTGKIVALVSGLYRSLVAHIGAAEVLPLSSLLAHPHFLSLFDNSDIILIEAYFLTNRFECAQYLVKRCAAEGKLLAFNLCGAYIFSIIPESIKYLVDHSNVIFGNKAEYIALSQLLNYSSIEAMALELIEDSARRNIGKTFVITDGSRPVICYSSQESIEMKPPSIKESEIEDTTAAGDAFIGGFLAGLVTSSPIRKCIEIGLYAASSIIKETGCSLPKYRAEIGL